jgi:hypothetical protein
MTAVQTKPSQREESLAKANEIRTEIRVLLERVASGEEAVANAVLTCELPLRVDRLLKAQKGWGPIKVQQALRRANTPSGPIYMGRGVGSPRRVLTADERRRLILVLAGRPATKDIRPKYLDQIQEREIRRRMERVGCSIRQIEQVVAA